VADVRRPDTASELTLLLPSEKREIATVRRSLRALLARHAVPSAIADDVVLSTQEACNNVIVHARNGALEVHAHCRRHDVLVEVRDRGRGFDVRSVDPRCRPDPYGAGGRGLFLIHHLMDRVEVSSGRAGTVVRMSKLTRTA
jgi:serine/threonine-protein kinase RsbW